MPLRLSFLQAKQAQLSAFPTKRDIPVPQSFHSTGPFPVVLFQIGEPKTEDSGPDVASPGQTMQGG